MEQFLNSLVFTVAILALIALIRLNKDNKLSVRSWIFAILAIVFIPFGLAWGVTSFYELETQAGWVGIFVFCGLGLVFGTLAWRNIFPKKASKSNETSKLSQNAGAKITAFLIISIGVIVLPVSICFNKTVNAFGSEDQLKQLIAENIISDKALPRFVKKTIAFETLYGEYPEKLEIRMIQSMFSGVKDEEMIKLLNFILPENARLQLLNDGSDAIAKWLKNEAAYPEFEIQPKQFLNQASANAEGIAAWIYHNFALPPMADTTIAKFERGEFSNNMKDYMGTPPAHLKDSLTKPLANVLRQQMAEANVPEKIILSEEIAKKTSEAEMLEQKVKMTKIPGLLGKLWLIPVILIIGGLCIVYFSKIGFKHWIAWTALAIGVGGLIFSSKVANSLGFIEGMIPDLAEKVPAPALAFMYKVIPNVFNPIGDSLMNFMLVFFLVGIVLLGVAYFKRVKSLVLN